MGAFTTTSFGQDRLFSLVQTKDARVNGATEQNPDQHTNIWSGLSGRDAKMSRSRTWGEDERANRSEDKAQKTYTMFSESQGQWRTELNESEKATAANTH